MSIIKKEIKRYAWYMDDIYQGLNHLDMQHSNHIIVESTDENDDEGYYLVLKTDSDVRYRHFNIIENEYLKNMTVMPYRSLRAFITCTFNNASKQIVLKEEEYRLGPVIDGLELTA